MLCEWLLYSFFHFNRYNSHDILAYIHDIMDMMLLVLN